MTSEARDSSETVERSTTGTTVAELRAEGRAALAEASFEISPREAALLLGRVLGWSEAEVFARSERRIESAHIQSYRGLVERRLGGEPVAYLFGERELYGYSFAVDHRVLVPRPETEHLIAAVLDRNPARGSRVVDVGTGSGCIALTLALERPDLQLLAIDRSLDALAVAADNRRRHRLEHRVQLLAGDLAIALAPRSTDLIVANLPYVDPKDRDLLSPEILDFEPAIALFAAGDGLAEIERLLEHAAALLRPGGAILLEIGARQSELLAERAHGYRVERIHPDYSGIDRVVELVPE